jgi:hypothetical protein
VAVARADKAKADLAALEQVVAEESHAMGVCLGLSLAERVREMHAWYRQERQLSAECQAERGHTLEKNRELNERATKAEGALVQMTKRAEAAEAEVSHRGHVNDMPWLRSLRDADMRRAVEAHCCATAPRCKGVQVTAPTKAERKRLRGLLPRATPGPVAVHRYNEDDGSIRWQVQSEHQGKGRLFAAVLCHHHDIDSPRARADAELHAEMRNALPGLLDALDAEEVAHAQLSDRCQTVADEAFGPFPTEPAETCLTYIEQGIFRLRQELATAEAERLTLARALVREESGDGEGLTNGESDLARRIVEEADRG